MRVNRIYFRTRKTFRRCVPLLIALGLAACQAENGRWALSEPIQSASVEAEFRTPDWAKGLVWYQVFPERFRDANPRNNPRAWDVTPIGWDSPFGEVGINEIERQWNRSHAEPERNGFDPNRDGGALRQVIYARRYGGDLQGVYEQLETLRDMGVTGIYLCPIFQSRSLHKYDASDHRHIDPTLGDPGAYHDPGPGHTALGAGEDPFDETSWAWTPADEWFVDVFLPRAKSLGLRVMLDGVWNHVGLDHFAFNDVREHGRDSAFADWFDVVFDDDGELMGWQGWSRVNGNLPEFKHIGEDLAPGPKAHIMAVTRRWMDPNGDGDPSDGIDGWRLDVAGEIGADFWRDWRAEVKSINPDALVVAEIWSDADKMLSDQAFDAQMNYPFAYPIADWLALGGDGVLDNASVLANRLTRVFHHGEQVDLVQLNLMDSHDTERLASMMQNRWARGYDNESSRWNPRYEHDRVSDVARDRALSAFATMIASSGAVMVYNGDEYALPGADDPDNRRPIPWGRFDDEQLAFQQRVCDLLRLRSDEDLGDVLRLGSARFDAIGAHTLRVTRELGDRRVEFFIAPEPGMLEMPEHADQEWLRDYEIERKLGVDQRKNGYVVRVFGRN